MKNTSAIKYSKEQYKIYSWKNWMMLHWMLNPGLVINELILGQRIPKITLVDKTIEKPKVERTFVPCPHCDTLHDSRTWTNQNGTAFKNWFGLYCNSCGKIIPCLLNVFSFLILAVTFPVWAWFRKSLKTNWLRKQPERFRNIHIEHIPNPFSKRGWIKMGLFWGAMMFVIMVLGIPFLEGEELTSKKLLIGVVVWTFAGLGFGYFMKLWTNRRPGKDQKKIEA